MHAVLCELPTSDLIANLAGGAMFVGCVVAGSVIMANGGVPARGALMRDMAAVVIAVSSIALVLASGSVSVVYWLCCPMQHDCVDVQGVWCRSTD